jgi:prevent-host-death family protein
MDVLPKRTAEDYAWNYAERVGMERELFLAIARPWVKNLSIRVLYALLNADIRTCADVIARGQDGLSRVRNLGPKGIGFIRQRLNAAAVQPDTPAPAEGVCEKLDGIAFLLREDAQFFEGRGGSFDRDRARYRHPDTPRRVEGPSECIGWPPNRATTIAVSAAVKNMRMLLRRVQRGETITLTQRGRPVAVLAPIPHPAEGVGRG